MRLSKAAFHGATILLALTLDTPLALAEDWRGALLGREVGIEVPPEFTPEPAYADASPEAAIVEFLPPDETIEAWTQVLTLTAYVDRSGQTAEQAALAMANRLAQGYGAACPGSFAAEDLGTPAIAWAEATFAAWLGCGEVGKTGQSEAVVVLVLALDGTVYTTQWAERGPAAEGPPVFDMTHWLPRLDALMTLQL